MLKAIATLFLLLTSALQQSECLEIKYLTDPSWQNLTCNPYGSALRLNCAIEEPSKIKIASKLLLLWYWTPVGGQPVNDSCQIYPSHQCDQLVSENKYDFNFKVTEKANITKRTVDLIIKNVGLEDQGCYNCRPVLNSLPLPFEQASGLFCLQHESHYEHLELCNVTSNKQTRIVTSNTITSTTTSYYATSTTSVLSESISTSPIPSGVQDTVTTCNKYPSLHFIAVSISICIGLCLLSFVQMLVIVYQCYWKHRCPKGCAGNRRNRNPTNVINATKSYTNNNERRSLPEPTSISSSQHFIGTYSFVEPNGNEECTNTCKTKVECSSKDWHKYERDTPIDDIETESGDTDSVAISILSPGAHIYQTLDKYLEQLVNNPPPLPPPSKRNRTEKKEKLEESNDKLFDDPNYSQVEIMEEDLEEGSRKNLSRQESQDTYDKLQPKMTDSEYAYAYSHIIKLRQQLRNLKRSDANPNPPGFCLELLHVAATGSYGIDSAVVSSTEKDKRPSTVAKKTRMKLKKEDGGKSDGQSTVVHQYQPLNENTLNNGSNSYAHLVKQ